MVTVDCNGHGGLQWSRWTAMVQRVIDEGDLMIDFVTVGSPSISWANLSPSGSPAGNTLILPWPGT